MNRVKRILVLTFCFLLSLQAVTASAADYTVVEGDSLYSLSKLFHTSVKTLGQSNNLNANSLKPGDVIYVPAHVYITKKGDTLYKIAAKYKIPLSKLQQANRTTGSSIVPFEKICIPGVKAYKKSDAVIPYTTSEIDLLARLIEAEASGESMQAKIAVGAVVINRVQSGEWASSIQGVINQRFGEYWQFTPVKIGTINNVPSAASKRAAWTAMFGADPSKQAIYYFDQSSTNQWLWSKEQTATLDHLIFTK